MQSTKSSKSKPLVDGDYLLEKFPGKGGWTYARIPEILPDRHSHFGWVKVKGNIHGFEIQKFHLMPMGNGQLFLSVNAKIRKVIKKEVGDIVRITLFTDNEPDTIPKEWSLCLKDEPKAESFFLQLSDSEQLHIVKYIYSAKTDDIKVERMSECLDLLMNGRWKI